MSRERASERRKREILEAALACFGELGYEKTTLAEIRARSEASTGSIYHHFRSKEHLFAALYLEPGDPGLRPSCAPARGVREGGRAPPCWRLPALGAAESRDGALPPHHAPR